MLNNKQGPNSSGLKQVGQLAGVVALHCDSEPQVASIFQRCQPGDLCFQMHPWRREHGENTQELTTLRLEQHIFLLTQGLEKVA